MGKFPLCSISISSVAQLVNHGTSDIKVMGLNTRDYTKLLQCMQYLELENSLNNKVFKLHKCKGSIVSSSHTQDCLYFDFCEEFMQGSCLVL